MCVSHDRWGGTGHRIAKFHVARDETTYFEKVVFPACASLESKYALCVLAICGSVNSVVWLSCIDSGGITNSGHGTVLAFAL